MKYFSLSILTLDRVAHKVLAKVDGHYVKDKHTFFPRIDRNNDNVYYPEGFFFDFLAVDDTINLGRRVRNFTLHDAMAWEGEQPGGEGFVLTPKLKGILEQFNRAPSKFYGAKLRSKYLFYDYNVVQFLEGTYLELTNLSNCIFSRYKDDKLVPCKEEYHIDKLEDLEPIKEAIWEEREKLEKSGYPTEELLKFAFQVGIKKWVLKKEFIGIDMIWCEFFRSYVISERLRDALIENNITGIEIKEIEDVEIVVGE